MKRRIAAILMSLVYSACTSAEPPTLDVTTTIGTQTSISSVTRPLVDPANWTMDQFVDSEALAWDRAFQTDRVPIGFASVGGTTFVMATSPRDGGLWIWSTTDGLAWRDHGEVVPSGDVIGAVGSTDRELLVVTAEGPGAEPHVLRSRDGTTWDRGDVPFDPSNPLLVFRPAAIGGSQGLTVIAGSTVLEPGELIARRFGNQYPAEVDAAFLGVSWDESGGDINVRLTAPPGFTIAEATATELGLTEREKSWLTDSVRSPELSLWIQSSSGDPWQPGILRDARTANSIFDSSDGEVFLATGSPAGSPTGSGAVFRTFDGFSWERLTSAERPLSASRGGDFLVGPSATGGDSDVLVSGDGLEWMRTHLNNRFPRAPVFTITYTAGGSAGVVATVESFDWTYREEDTVGSGRPTLEKDGLTVAITDLIFGPNGLIDGPNKVAVYRGERNEVEPYLFAISGPPERDDLSIDVATETITFRDDDSEELVAVAFGEMDDLLYRTLAPTRHFTRAHSHALAYSTDTTTWTLWDLAELVGENGIADVGLAGDRALVAVDHGDSGFEVWATTLP